MEKSDSETEMEKLEQEDLDELENPYRPYFVTIPYEVRFGRNEKDILLQKEIDNRYGRDTYSKHILDWVSKRLPTINPRECDLEYIGTPKVAPIDHDQVKDFIEGYLNDE